jgi:RNA methyltransferase, trmH family
VSETVKEKADACVKIPMLGQTESLNVAMAATVCLFEQMRQRIHAQAVRKQ